jgi:coatomer subunit delta
VRYVYQPLENYFVLIITNKTSNIVEDLHTIQVLSKLVPDICGSLNENAIRDKQFELIFGFDELISAGGHSENINVQQIRVNMEMESHEEKLHNMIQESKRAAAKDDMKRHTIRIKEEQRERARLERAGLGGYAKQTGFGNAMSSGFGSSPRNGGVSPSNAASFASSNNMATSPTSYNRPEPSAPIAKTSGMKLGGGGKSSGKSFLDAMAAEDDLKEIPPMSAPVQAMAPPTPTIAVSSDPIGVVVEEKLSVVLNRDGTLEQLEVKGSLFVSVNDQDSAACRLKLRSSNANGVSFQTHPKVDKRLFDQESVLGLKVSSTSVLWDQKKARKLMVAT